MNLVIFDLNITGDNSQQIKLIAISVTFFSFEPPGCLRVKGVPRVFPECQKGVQDTLGTLFGHSGALGDASDSGGCQANQAAASAVRLKMWPSVV